MAPFAVGQPFSRRRAVVVRAENARGDEAGVEPAGSSSPLLCS
jgi:hypothetical protein